MQESIENEINRLNAQFGEFWQQGLYEEALPSAMQLREFVKQELGKENFWYSLSQKYIGQVHTQLSNYALAQKCLKNAEEIILRLEGKTNLQYISILLAFASLYEPLGKLREAEDLYLQVLEIQKQLDSSDNQITTDCKTRIERIREALENCEPGGSPRFLSEKQLEHYLLKDAPIYTIKSIHALSPEEQEKFQKDFERSKAKLKESEEKRKKE